jgi:hypothetical protein
MVDEIEVAALHRQLRGELARPRRGGRTPRA